MLDRTIAPPSKAIGRVDVQQAQSQLLASGIPVHYINTGQQAVVKLELINRAGSSYQTRGGTSFFTTRMLTEGTTRHNSNQLAESLDYYGAQIDLNPGMDFASISIYLLRKHLKEVIQLLNEMLTDSVFGPDDLELQKKLKKDSLLVNLEKNQFLASRKIREAIFGPVHPYGKSLEIEMIDEVSREQLLEFYKHHYFNQSEIIMSGMIDDSVLTILDDYLTFQSSNIPQSLEDFPIETARERIYEKPDSLQSSIRMGKPSINKQHPDYINLLVVNEILGGFFGSRLMKNIREEKGFTYGVSSNVMNLHHDSIQVIGTDVKKVNTQETLDEVFKEIYRLQTEPLVLDELETVKNYMQGSFLSSITTPFSIADKFKAIHFHGLDYDFYDNYLQTIKEISPSTIMRVANEHMKTEAFSIVVVGGK